MFYILLAFLIIYYLFSLPCSCCHHKKKSGTQGVPSTPPPTPCLGYSTSVKPTNTIMKHSTSTIVTNPQNPTPGQQTPNQVNKTLDKYYNFTTSPLTQDVFSISGAYLLFNPSDLLSRKPLYNLPIGDTCKSVLLESDILDVGKKVMHLKSLGNVVGAQVDISSLLATTEDVQLLNLEFNVDYNLYRTLPKGIEYLPMGDEEGKPTDAYTHFIKQRISQLKRCGFDFIQFGVFDPFSIFNYQEPEEYSINDTLSWNGYQKFLLHILKYTKELELKISLSEFPRIFENDVEQIARYIDFVNIFTVDPRAFIKPSREYIYYFHRKPIFLTTLIKVADGVIPYFVYNTSWPIKHSILYETSTLVDIKYNEPTDSIVVCNRYLDWCFPPKRTWQTPVLRTSLEGTSIPILPPTLPLYPMPKLNPPR